MKPLMNGFCCLTAQLPLLHKEEGGSSDQKGKEILSVGIDQQKQDDTKQK